MLRIDEENTGQTLQKQELPAQAVRALEPKNASNSFEDEENEPDNFATLKAQAWGRMVPGQIGQHLSELREQAEKLRLPEAASPSLAIRVLHYHCDHLGTPRELTDESGKLAWSAEYMAWGKLKRLQGRAGGSADAGNGGIPPDQFWHTSTQPGRANHLPEWVADNTGNVRRWREAQEVEQSEISQAANDPTVWGELTDQSIRFQGQWHDVETGLHYNRFRYYDPDIGRFVSQDPIGLLGGYNLFAYAPSPLNWIDPDGLNKKRMNVRDSGHHAPAVRKAKGRPFEMARSNKCWPTLFPKGKDPEHDHWRLHEAERKHIGPRQGDYPGTDQELFKAYEKAYSSAALKKMKVDLKSPDGTVTLCEDCSPLEAIKKMQDWLRQKGMLCP